MDNIILLIIAVIAFASFRVFLTKLLGTLSRSLESANDFIDGMNVNAKRYVQDSVSRSETRAYENFIDINKERAKLNLSAINEKDYFGEELYSDRVFSKQKK